jgi:hypothetical protein
MIFTLIMLTLANGVGGRGFVLKTYSAVVSSPSGWMATVSVVPDPNTGDLQPIIAMNVTPSPIYVGGSRSYAGGVATLPYSFTQGDRRLDLFDFSRGGWPSKKSTVVSKSGSLTTYTSNCTISTGCSYLYSGGLSSVYGANAYVTLVVNSRRNIPLYINISTSWSLFSWSFDQFDTDASTYQPDDSIYTLPAYYYPASSIPMPTTPNVTTISFYRSFGNDSFARNLANDNAASPAGEANFICPSPRTGFIIAQFDVTVDGNFGPYAMCNRGSCACNLLTECQRVGQQLNGIAADWWYSFPQSAMCADGFPIGTNNCTWQSDFKLVSAITADCFNTIKGDPNYPNGYSQSPSCSNLNTVGAHVIFSLRNCPDVKDSLPWPYEW